MIEPERADAPHSITLGKYNTGRHFLTHCRWVPEPHFSSGSNETGIRSVIDGVVQDDFQLIQHGWPDWQYADTVIVKQLAKGRSVRAIEKLMDYMKEKRMIYLKAVTL